ncbi:hypothetical protein BU24DRAFT_62620 [Aaosphaeria arxii CBS 175.79]|uniref:Uncharacterized protein n=1 Tax=Aaosphaeria arxii CBS 175.79 TaxID=1450172 RepID=A0A6A5XCL4_9PLEO|nr:uncharacterized protein BU24DRAFT_62620 [Aaosphaeria arxii CBS 175.79]KAF2010660.1 hypothetical protein BU24DRAFT_62620 [Aaosphaeria arxii CBS 175.79]
MVKQFCRAYLYRGRACIPIRGKWVGPSCRATESAHSAISSTLLLFFFFFFFLLLFLRVGLARLPYRFRSIRVGFECPGRQTDRFLHTAEQRAECKRYAAQRNWSHDTAVRCRGICQPFSQWLRHPYSQVSHNPFGRPYGTYGVHLLYHPLALTWLTGAPKKRHYPVSHNLHKCNTHKEYYLV